MAYGVVKREVSLDVLDVGGNIMVMTYQLQADDDAEADTAAGDFVTAFKTVTECFVPSYRVNRVLYDPLVIGTPISTLAMNSVQAITSAQLAAALKFASFAIPGPKASVFAAATGKNRNIVNVAAEPMLSFFDSFKGGGQVYISDGELINAVENAQGVRRTTKRRLAK